MYQALFFSLSSQRSKETEKKITPDLRLGIGKIKDQTVDRVEVKLLQNNSQC